MSARKPTPNGRRLNALDAAHERCEHLLAVGELLQTSRIDDMDPDLLRRTGSLVKQEAERIREMLSLIEELEARREH